MRYPSIVSKYPHILHGGDYNPDQWIKWKDLIWKEDMRLAKLAGINSLSVGIFSWAALEPEEGNFTFEWLDEVMDMLADNGMVAVLATPSGARPAWLSKKYPEVLRVRANRLRNRHGERHNHCMSSPAYRELVCTINTKLAERYGKHPALGVWHISNEYGGECHCDLCQEKFRGFLQQKYGALDDLNAAYWASFWSHTYTDWAQLESPGPHGESNTHALTLDWKRFTTQQHIDFFRHETLPMKRLTPDIPCTANLMGVYPGIDYFALAKDLDVVSWDAYPQWKGDAGDIETGSRFAFLHDLMRGLKARPFMLMESSPSATNWQETPKLRRPGIHMLQSMQALAHGADTVQYFQFRKGRGAAEKFHGAVVDHEGTENTRVFRDVAEVGERLRGLDDIVGMDAPSRVALIYDWNVRWALDDIKGLAQGNNHYAETVIEHYRSLWRQGISVDIMDQTRDFSKYDLLIAPMLYMLRGNIAERIDAFVQGGGTFVATYATGYADESDLCFLGGFPGPLKDTLGIWNEEFDALYPEDRNTLDWNGQRYEIFDACELIHLRGAAMLGTYGQDFYAGRPVLTMNKRGKGRAYYIAARTGRDFLDDFYRRLADERSILRVFTAPLPEGVSAQVRSDGENEVVFIMNFTDNIKYVDTGKDGTIELAPFGVQIIRRKAQIS